MLGVPFPSRAPDEVERTGGRHERPPVFSSGFRSTRSSPVSCSADAMPSAELHGHQLLAAAVIRQALADAVNPTRTRDQRADAIAFLSTPWFRFWCDVAGLDPDRVRGTAIAQLPWHGRPRPPELVGRCACGAELPEPHRLGRPRMMAWCSDRCRYQQNLALRTVRDRLFGRYGSERRRQHNEDRVRHWT